MRSLAGLLDLASIALYGSFGPLQPGTGINHLLGFAYMLASQ
jgi:hypothetical protein